MNQYEANHILAGGGEMGALMRSIDWSKTSLGPVEAWPQSLRTSVSICLNSRFPILIWWGPEFLMLYNDAYRPMLGKTKHPKAMGRPGRECWPEIWPIIGPMLTSVLERGEATWSDDQLLLLDRNGYLEECYFTFSYSPIRDDSGRVAGVFCAVTETTSRVIGERRLRTLRQLGEYHLTDAKNIEQALQAAAISLAGNPYDFPFALIYLVEQDGKNARLSEAVNIDDERIPKVVAIDGNDPWGFREVIKTAQSRIIDGLEERFGRLPAGPWKDDSTRRALVMPLARSGDIQTGFLVTGVSPRLTLGEDYRTFFELAAKQIDTAIANARVYEDERRRAEELAELDRAKTVFFSNISHEFRTPLTLMLGPLEDLLQKTDETLAAEEREQLELIHRNSLRLLKLVNTLLEFSRIEAGRIQASYEPTDLSALTSELASVFRSAVEKAGLRLIVNCPRLSEPVYVDREMWEKIVLNLISNAFKFTFAGEIEISLREDNTIVEVSVRDTGTGIPVSELPHVFERFHRIKGAQGRTYEGSGIGLALTQELVRLHGGTIRVESEVNRGSRFIITIPRGIAHLPADRIGTTRPARSNVSQTEVGEALSWLRSESTERAAQASASMATPASSRPLILLADDNSDMRDYVRGLLGAAYEVIEAEDGQAAIESAREHCPNLVLTDVMMPRLDGFGLLREIRSDERLKTTPVIMLSARAGEEARIEGLEASADDYLVKPFSARELLARIESHLTLRRMRTQWESKLLSSESKFSAAFEQSPLALTITSLETGKLVEVNDGFVALSGYSREESIGRTTLELNLWVEPEKHSEGLARLRAGEKLYGLEVRFRRKSGEELIGVVGSSLVEIDSRPHVVSSVADMTERKHAEELLRQSATQLALIADTAPVLIAHCDADQRFLFVNKPYADMFGVAQEDCVGKRIVDLVGEHAYETFRPHIESVLHGNRVEFEAEVAYPNIGAHVMHASYAPEFDSGGRVVGWVSITADVTSRRRVEELSRVSEERFRMLANNMSQFAWTCDHLGFATWYNQRWYDYTGTTWEQMQGDGWKSVHHPEHVDRVIEGLKQALETGEEWEDTFPLRGKDGSYRWFLSRAVPISGANRDIVSWFGTNTDITEQRAAEEALRETDKRKDEFLAMLAHELRNPLAPVRNAVEVLRLMGAASTEQQWAREVIERQTQHLTRLVDDLLDVSRITQGKIILQPQPLDVANVIKRAIEASRPLIDSQKHELTIKLPAEPVRVNGDLTRLVQVIANLLNNAAKYTDPGGHIWLQAERDNDEVVIRVADDGMGVPSDLLPHVFDLFSQADRSLDRSHGGLGIGLTLVRRLVELHGGRAEARSEGLGHGSEFTLRLPLLDSNEAASAEPQQDQGSRPAESLRVLVIEDNVDSAEMLAYLLKLNGYEVRVTHDGRQALSEAIEFQPQAVLCDIGLPGMSGYEVGERLRAHPAFEKTPLIALTGYGQGEARQQAREAGFDYHLVKPVEPDALAGLLASLFEPAATTGLG